MLLEKTEKVMINAKYIDDLIVFFGYASLPLRLDLST